MNAKVRKQLTQCKRKLLQRISAAGSDWQSPMIRSAATKIELAEKQQAVDCGGFAIVNQLIEFFQGINRARRNVWKQQEDDFLIRQPSKPTERWWKQPTRRSNASGRKATLSSSTVLTLAGRRLA